MVRRGRSSDRPGERWHGLKAVPYVQGEDWITGSLLATDVIWQRTDPPHASGAFVSGRSTRAGLLTYTATRVGG